MDLNNLTDDQKAKACACETADELVELAGEQGMEFSDNQLDGVQGGVGDLPNLPGVPGFCPDYTLEGGHH